MERRQWSETRKKKEMGLYEEWLHQEKVAQQATSPRRNSVALHALGDTASVAAGSSSTIRAVSPEYASSEVGRAVAEDENALVPGPRSRTATSFERSFIPHTTTTITGGATGTSSRAKHRKLVKDKDKEREANGSSVRGMLERSTSSTRKINSSSNGNRNGNRALVSIDLLDGYRPRTRTIDERRRERSPPRSLRSSRNRIGSVNMPSSGAEYLASVPASISPPAAPSISSFGSPTQQALDDICGPRSPSPDSSNAGDSMTSKSSASRRILHLTNVLKGRMSGNVVLRRDRESPWTDLYCYIKEETGRLMYEPKGAEGADRTLVPGLRGCNVKPNVDGETPYLEVSLPQTSMEIHFKLLTQSDFDSWFAALLWWQYLDSKAQPNGPRPPSSISGVGDRPELPPRTSSARVQRDRASSNKSDRRRSVISPKEAPVIKIGKMIFWDTNVGYSNTPGSGNGVGQPTTGRPPAYRMQSYGSRRWRRISGQLRENGELKLYSDADNSLISVVQLSQLSRCAIQRLDPSVLDNEFCIAIYPQYNANHTNSQPGFVRPIFLTFENRVLFEVWFVLLRAFTIPQLYGPPGHQAGEGKDELTSGIAGSTKDMFRVERTLNFRVVEARLFPPTASNGTPESSFSGGHGRPAPGVSNKPEQHGYYAEILLDDETRGKTPVKFEGLNPLWGESFEFLDLPAVLGSVNVVVKRRPPDSAHAREQHESRLVHEAYGFTSDQHGGFTGLTFDVTCGKVEVYLHELEGDKEVERWWPVVNMYNQRIGEVLLKTRMNEGVILMERDYRPLGDLLHRFSNGLTLQIAQMVPAELKRVSDCLLNIYQVSGKAGDWIMALVEEEIDGIHKETPISRLRYNRRAGSDASHDNLGIGCSNSDRELIVRDMNKNATLEANLLFRGNTLLTKSLDTHMRRVGKEYLEESLGPKIREINEKDPDCEVDPSRVHSHADVERNWGRLLLNAQEVWKAIVASKHRCPIELRVIFRHIRACAEDRYGDFLRSVSYSSVSGFLFLRFFCPAILNPKLFGLSKEDVKPRTRRTFTLIAKSLQTLSNMASFGAKETWMEPMNAFLTQSREGFKSFIDEICYVPTPLTAATHQGSFGSSPTYPASAVSADTHLSYTTPNTIMQRLPPTSREGFPSLPYLIDQARAFAELVQLWLDATMAMSQGTESTANAKSHAEVMAAIKASGGDLLAFHQICTRLYKRTQECLSRAERAERPNSSLSFRWEELIDQLQPASVGSGDELLTPQLSSPDILAERVASDDSIVATPSHLMKSHPREWIVPDDEEQEELATKLYDPTPSHSASRSTFEFGSTRDRPGSSGVVGSLRDSLRRAQLQSRASRSPSHSMTASASASNVSSDTELSGGTTALPSYERERSHRERRDAAKQRIHQEVEAARLRESEKDRRKVKTPIVSALRKKKERESRSNTSAPVDGRYMREGYTSHG
ncbi:GTPase activating factor [Vermiconidia calcicola]|uniref:GTPase activating factor n=1 Tax=Vermiconidia calcicola TaxID=1690605 RepID=A0ACC3MLV0_9PEZI|nr:GTPase activating factor [Vermiconidia calcicola]